MNVACLAKDKILVKADIFNPPVQSNGSAPTWVSSSTLNLVENLQR